eukprot:3907914-Prymnesium_polylepis.1
MLALRLKAAQSEDGSCGLHGQRHAHAADIHACSNGRPEMSAAITILSSPRGRLLRYTAPEPVESGR